MLKKVPFMLELIKANINYPLQLLDLGKVFDLIVKHGSDIEGSWNNVSAKKRYDILRKELDDALSYLSDELGTWAFLGPIDIAGASNRYVVLVRCSSPSPIGFRSTPTLAHLLSYSHAERSIVPTVIPTEWAFDYVQPEVQDDE